MSKFLWGALALVLAVVIGGAWWLHSSLDSVVASAIRSYGPQITGVSVHLDSVKIQPVDGAAALHGLQLGNPKGFKTDRALSVGQVSMQLDMASVTSDVVVIKDITIEQPEVTYEYASGGSNLDVIQRNVDAFVAQAVGKDTAPKGKEKKLIIEKLTMRGAHANVSADMLKGKSMTVPLPDLHMADIGKKSGGVTPAEATRQIVSALTENAKKAVTPTLGGTVDTVKKGAGSAVDAVKGFFK